MLHQGACHHEEALQFVVPMAYRVVDMNGCHRDVGHQGQWWTLSWLQNQFWWPGLVMWMQKVISGCERCIQHEGAWVKAPLQAILDNSPLDLLHVDFTGIEMTVKLDWPPHIVNVLVFCDHFTRHAMAYVTPDQMAKTVAKFLWQGYILIFGALAKLLSYWGATFERATSSVSCASSWAFGRWELCSATPKQMDKWSKSMKYWCGWLGNWVKIERQTGLSISQSWCMLTTPWDQPSPGTACITWCLGDDLACLLTFISPQLSAQKNASVSITTLLDLHGSNCMQSLQRSAKAQSSSEAERQRWYYDLQGQLPFHRNQVTWSWQKPMHLQREEKGERPVGEGTVWSGMPDCQRNPFIPPEEPADLYGLTSPPSESTSSHHPCNGNSFMYKCMSRVDKVCHHHPGGTYSREQVRMRKSHRVQSVSCQPSIRLVRLL